MQKSLKPRRSQTSLRSRGSVRSDMATAIPTGMPTIETALVKS